MEEYAPAVAPEVHDALMRGAPVVALETAVITHGLPRTPLPPPPCCADSPHPWDPAIPANLALARLLDGAVRAAGAVPAAIGMLHGRLVVGVSPAQMQELADVPAPRKLSARDLGPAAVAGACGGTTVAATLAACARVGIRVFATGGIGGVHRGWTARPDISADLYALARSPVAVISAGAKSVLDLPATVEMLDTLGIPVLGLGTPFFPRFTAPGTDGLRVQVMVADATEAARTCVAHWTLNPGTGVLVAAPPPPAFAMPMEEMEAATRAAQQAADQAGVHGAALTPFLLEHLARATQGRSVNANVAVLLNNASTGGHIAAELAAKGTRGG